MEQKIELVNTLNMLMVTTSLAPNENQVNEELIETWLQDENNYNQLQRACDEIFHHYSMNQTYPIERAFFVVGRRLCSIVKGAFDH